MPKIKTATLLSDQRAALEKGAKYASPPVHGHRSYRMRCQALLLKSDPTARRTSQQVVNQIGCCKMSVNGWVKRYQSEGIGGQDQERARPQSHSANRN